MISLPSIIGHRGAAALAPENTLAGFRRAAAEGVAWVEFDTRLAADGPVVLHDPTLDRTSSGRGPVRALPIAALDGIDCGRWFGPAFAGERLPTLAQALDAVAGLGLGANVELKAEPGLETELARAVAEAVRAVWPAPGRLLFSSFSQPALAALADLVPEIPRGLLVGELPPDWREAAERLGCVSVHPDHRKLTPAGVRAVKEAGFLLAAYTVNALPEARRLLSWGVDSIITDRPDLMRDLL